MNRANEFKGTISVTEIRNNTKKVIEKVKQNNGAYLITKRHKGIGVILDFKYYDSILEERELLLRAIRGFNDIAEGRVMSLEEVRKRLFERQNTHNNKK